MVMSTASLDLDASPSAEGIAFSEIEQKSVQPLQIDHVHPSCAQIVHFTEDELSEMEFLRDQEIDAVIEAGFLGKEERWNPERRDGFHFVFPEMIVDVKTGIGYPVNGPIYTINNISLPNAIIDRLRIALRDMIHDHRSTNCYERWCQRDSTPTGCFEFEMTALQLAQKSVRSLEEFRNDPTYYRRHAKNLRPTDYHLLEERRFVGGCWFDWDCLYPDGQGRGKGKQYDPLNEQWKNREGEMTNEQKLTFSDALTERQITNSMWGIDAATIKGHDFANTILGKTPKDVCAEIPDIFRILHVESVIRSDLAARFFGHQAEIRKFLDKMPLTELQGCLTHETRSKLGKRIKEKETLVELLVEPTLSFHCTREDSIPSIVRHGFIKPRETEVRCGSTYGLGIYSSPDPFFSLMYTHFRGAQTTASSFAGLKMIACATIMGACKYVTRNDEWYHQTEPMPGATCHVANDCKEYIVFNNAQIIPLYVIHLDLGRDIASFLAAQTDDAYTYIRKERAQNRTKWAKDNTKIEQGFGPGDKQRAKQALVAKAKKYFPYGYGAAEGSKFQVLEVGEVSDDEEEYGEYQRDRKDDVGKEGSFDIWSSDDTTNFALDQNVPDVTVEIKEAKNAEKKREAQEINPDQEPHEDGEQKNESDYQVGPLGRTKFDQFYEARMAKNKKSMKAPKLMNH